MTVAYKARSSFEIISHAVKAVKLLSICWLIRVGRVVIESKLPCFNWKTVQDNKLSCYELIADEFEVGVKAQFPALRNERNAMTHTRTRCLLWTLRCVRKAGNRALMSVTVLTNDRKNFRH